VNLLTKIKIDADVDVNSSAKLTRIVPSKLDKTKHSEPRFIRRFRNGTGDQKQGSDLGQPILDNSEKIYFPFDCQIKIGPLVSLCALTE
jgi:hypothetical protein